MKPVRYLLSAVVAASILLAFSWSASADSEVLHGGTNGKAHVMKVKAAKHGQNSSSNLYYHGGVGGVGVETAPAVYVTFWGWSGGQNDPAHVAPYLQNFLTGVGGSAWLSSTTQYCQGVASGTYTCGTSGAPA